MYFLLGLYLKEHLIAHISDQARSSVLWHIDRNTFSSLQIDSRGTILLARLLSGRLPKLSNPRTLLILLRYARSRKLPRRRIKAQAGDAIHARSRPKS